MAIVCGLCLGSSQVSLDVSPDTLTVPSQVLIVQGQAPPAIQVSLSYQPSNKCRGDVAFTWDSQAWGSAPVAPGGGSQTCAASLTARPPAAAAGAGQHTVCASSSSAGDCKTLTIVVTAPKPTPTPRASTPPPSPSPLTAVLVPDFGPSPDVTASSRPNLVQKAGGVSAWAGTGFAILLGVVAIGGFGLAMLSMVRGGPPA